MNQVVLAHELRHALQDQYEDLYSFLDESVSDFDDRRLAWMSLLEGDATLVMERFVKLRLGRSARAGGRRRRTRGGGARGTRAVRLAGGPAGRARPARAALRRGPRVRPRGLGARRAAALREAWGRPPESTEQVLHPEKFFERERPRAVAPLSPPPGARLVSSGVLGELLLRTLVEGDGWPGDRGLGGDGWRLGTSGGGRRSPGAASGTARRTRPSSTPPCARASRGGQRRRARGEFEVFRARAGSASRCAGRRARWSSPPPTTHGSSSGCSRARLPLADPGAGR